MGLFDEISRKVSDAGRGVSQQAKNLADSARLNSALSTEKETLSKLCAELGKAYYKAHRTDAEEAFAPQVAAIAQSLMKIGQYQEELKQLKGVTQCPVCGADVPGDAAFCNCCGTRVEAAVEEEMPEGGKICPSCGKRNSEEDSFCVYCGSHL